MATLDITRVAPIVSGLFTEGHFGGIFLTWGISADDTFDHTEIWASQTNDLDTASLYALVKYPAHTFDFVTGAGETWYFWIRGVNAYAQAGEYYPPTSAISSGSTGAQVPSSNPFNSGTGTGNWSGALSTVQTADGVFRTATQDATNNVFITNYYGFLLSSLISSDASITAIEYTIKAKVSSITGTPTLDVYLSWDAPSPGKSHFSSTGDFVSSIKKTLTLTTSNTTYSTVGSPAVYDDWGLYRDIYGGTSRPITVADVRNNNFGLRIDPNGGANGTVWSIDYIAINVFWELGSGVVGTSASSVDDNFTVTGNLIVTGTGHDVQVPYTNTATVGAVTINEMSGRVNIAAAGTSVVVTNSLVATTSRIFATVSTNDTTAYIKNVVPAAGSFTIHLGAAATAQTAIDFVVFN
jgi:hypothetical protein